MKTVKCIESFTGETFTGSPGVVLTVPDAVAADFVQAKYVEVIGDAGPDPKPERSKKAETAEAPKVAAKTATAPAAAGSKPTPPAVVAKPVTPAKKK